MILALTLYKNAQQGLRGATWAPSELTVIYLTVIHTDYGYSYSLTYDKRAGGRRKRERERETQREREREKERERERKRKREREIKKRDIKREKQGADVLLSW